MRIVIDMQGAQTDSRFRGIGRYSSSLALAMSANARGHEIWLVMNAAFPESIADIRRAFSGIIPQQRLRVFDTPLPVAEFSPGNDWRTRTAEKLREHFIQNLQPDVVLVISLFEGYRQNATTSVGIFDSGVKTAVILYDLIPLLNPDIYLPSIESRQYYFRKIESLKKADLLLAISEYSRGEAIEALQLAHDRVVNISTAVDPYFRPGDNQAAEISVLRQRLGITRKAVMYAPGGFDTRKNLDGLIAAYSLIASDLRSTHQLVIASKLEDSVRTALEQMRYSAGLLPDEVILTGYLTEYELRAMYRDATLFVFPSKHEGFGLPALEAMTCGTPVIGADITSIPEVIENPDALFDPFQPQSIADKIAQVLQNEPMRNQLREQGLKQAKHFSWDETAKRAIVAIEKLASDESEPNKIQTTNTSLIAAIANIETTTTPAQQDLIKTAACIGFNSVRNRLPQLLLDISQLALTDARTGIQRVVRSLLCELLKHLPLGFEVLPIYFDGKRYRIAHSYLSKITGDGSHVDDEVVDFCQDDIYLSLDLNAMTLAVHDAHLRLKNKGVQFYFIVYDILLLQRPDWWPTGFSATFESWLRSIAKVSSGLICISESVAQDVRSWFAAHLPYDAPDIAVASFHLGADIGSSMPSLGVPDSAYTVLEKLNAKSSFLMVGTVEPRKGHAQALAGFEQLWHQGVAANLVIVGKQGWLLDQLTEKLRYHPELNKQLFWLEGISDEYLEKLYAASCCLIVASEGEGFGLPLIEAAQHKLPIIARDIPVFREVAGEHALYFSGLKPSDLAHTVSEWLSLNSNGIAPQSVSMPWLTWRESAQQLLTHINLNAIFDEKDKP